MANEFKNQLTTNRNGGNHTIRQQIEHNPDSKKYLASIISGIDTSKDFKRFKVGNEFNSPCWCNISMENIKNNRRTEISFEIDKKQLGQLIENMQAIYNKIDF